MGVFLTVRDLFRAYDEPESHKTMSLRPGSALGHYNVTAHIGDGD